MTGPETWHVTRDPKTGEVTAQQDPSTLGEKWGRIAATALGGAVAGLQNAQGPGGLLKATAAGTATGLQQPQKTQDDAQQQVDFGNKQLLAKATRIHLTQQTYLLSQQTKALELKYDQDTADNLNKWYDTLASSPNAVDLGTMDPSEPNALIKFSKDHPEAMDAFLGKGNQRLTAIPGPDHKLHMVLTDRSFEDQRIDSPMPGFYIGTDQNGRASLQSKLAQPGSTTLGELSNHNLAVTTAWQSMRKTQADADLAEARAKDPNAPKTLPEINLAIEQETNPVKKAQLTAARDATVKQQKDFRTINATTNNIGITAPGTSPTDMIKQGGKFGPETIPGVNAQKMATGDETLEDMPKRMAKGVATPQEMVAAAEAYSQQLYGLGYSPTMVGAEKKQFDNMKVQGILDGIDKMAGTNGQPGYLDTVVRLGQAAGVGPNAPWNTVALEVKKKFGDQAAKNFNTALGEVQRSLPALIGNPLLGGADSDLKQRMAQDMFGKDVTAGNLLSTAGTLNGMLQGSKDSLTRNNRFLQRRYGLKGPYAAQYSPTQGAPATPQQPQQPQNPQNGPQPQLPQALPGLEVRFNRATNEYRQLQGKQWVQVAPPVATR